MGMVRFSIPSFVSNQNERKANRSKRVLPEFWNEYLENRKILYYNPDFKILNESLL